MKGTEKQVKWATEIVNDFYATIAMNLKIYDDGNHLAITDKMAAFLRKQKVSMDNFCKTATAADIIERRRYFDPARFFNISVTDSLNNMTLEYIENHEPVNFWQCPLLKNRK